jgi:hypothetical protein
VTYVLLSLFWTLAGLAVGYWLGRLGRLEALVSTPPDPAEPGGLPAPEAVLVSEEVTVVNRGRVMDRVLGLVLVVLAVLSVASSVVFISKQQESIDRQAATAACQNAFNRATAASTVERAEAAAKERQGQRQLLAVSFNPSTTPSERVAAYQSYLALLAEADAQRSANPLPVSVC